VIGVTCTVVSFFIFMTSIFLYLIPIHRKIAYELLDTLALRESLVSYKATNRKHSKKPRHNQQGRKSVSQVFHCRTSLSLMA